MVRLKRKLTVIDVFCGAGGFSEGFEKAGFTILRGYDNWKTARDTFEYNHPGSEAIGGDIIELSKLPDKEFHSIFPDSDIIIGSPPCVSFSNSNRSGHSSKKLGIALIEALLRIVMRKKIKRGSQLKYWILENVPNSKKFIKSKYSNYNLGVKSKKYTLKVKSDNSSTYSALAFGAPTKRKRYFCGEFPDPITNHVDYNELSFGRVITELSTKYPIDPNWRDMGKFEYSDITDHDYLFQIPRWQWEKAKRQKQDKGYMGRMSFPENLEEPCRTITALCSFSGRESIILSNGLSNNYRSPTIREFATAMSFPLDYRISGKSLGVKIKQIGNAVPPKMSYGIATAILRSEKLRPEKVGKRSKKKHNDHGKYCFTNLNGTEFSVKEEREKKLNSKFTYHIPYLKIKLWRTELTNISNGLSVGRPRYNCRLAYSQGALQARTYSPKSSLKAIKNIKLSEAELDKILSLSQRVKSHRNLQINYKRTLKYREKNKIIGPFEVLNEFKELIKSYNDDDYISIKLNKENIIVPYKVVLSYKMLKVFLNNLK